MTTPAPEIPRPQDKRALPGGAARNGPGPTAAPQTTIAFKIPGAPQGKARPRFRIAKTRFGKQFVSVYTPAATMRYELEIAQAAKRAMRAERPLDGPVELCVTAVMPVPPSWTVNKRNAALTENLRPTGKPDFDNIEKVVADAIKGVVWLDDSQVCISNFRKKYGPEPMLLVEVHALDRTLLPLFSRDSGTNFPTDVDKTENQESDTDLRIGIPDARAGGT